MHKATPNSFFVYKHIYVLHQNIAGLISKSDHLTVSLDELYTEKHIFPDVICLTEHNMTDSCKDILFLPNYRIAAAYSRTKKKGGSCILIRNGLLYKDLVEIMNLSICGVFECCAIELPEHKIIIVCVYRIPKSKQQNMYIGIFLEKLEAALQILCKKYKHNIIVCGDFNIDRLKYDKNAKDFESLLASYGLKLQINQPTRLSSGTCLDNIVTNSNKCKCDVIEFALSDHSAQLLKYPVQKTCIIDCWKVKKRDYCRENLQKFKHCLENITFNDLYLTEDPNSAFNSFIDEFMLFYNLCFPIRNVTIRANKKTKWISKGIKISSKNKRKLLWKYRQKPSLANKLILKSFSKRF